MSATVSRILADVPLPRMFRVKQSFPRPHIAPEEISAQLRALLEREDIAARIKPGMHICITGSSRGINHQAMLLRTIVDFVLKRGAQPFIVPGMGSHGGATAEGQKGILAGYGITEETMGCPIRATMEVRYIGDSADGRPVRIDKNAADADGIIVFNRIKPHSAFRGPYESGLMKMMAIGLGKQAGAEVCHSAGIENMHYSVPTFGRAVLKYAPVLFGVAVLENAYDETAKLAVLGREEIESEEPKLLREAFDWMPRLYVKRCDVLVVDQIGKNFSGSGMDPNIVGNFMQRALCPDFALEYQRIAVLDVSDESHGHCTGLGFTHATTRRLYNKFNFASTYANAATSTLIEGVRIPPIMDNDREAVQMCIQTCSGIDRHNAAALRLIRIPNSLYIEHIQLSEAYLPEMKQYAGLSVESDPEPMNFDENGDLF